MLVDATGRPIRKHDRILYPLQRRQEGIRLTPFTVAEVLDDRIRVEGGPLKTIKTVHNTVIVGRGK